MIVGLRTDNFPNVPTKLRKSLGGGGSGYASVRQRSKRSDFISRSIGQSHAVS